MTTRNYSFVVNVILAASRDLTPTERVNLKREITVFLNRNWKIDHALHHATQGRVQITGRAQVRVPQS